MTSSTSDLILFVRESLMRGQSKGEIEQALRDAGWEEARISEAIGSFADVEFPVPVPVATARPVVSARDAFLYLVLFSTLGLCAWYFGSLLFQLVNIYFPDPLSRMNSDVLTNVSERKIRAAISVLAVALPLYVFMTVKISREVERDSVKLGSAIRKWLTWLTLFVATLVVLGDVAALIRQFLNGSLSVNVGLKIAIVAAISGVIFFYYLRAVTRDDTTDSQS